MTYSSTCPECGEELYRDDIHCPSCGVRRPEPTLASAPSWGPTRLFAATSAGGEGSEVLTCASCGGARMEGDEYCASCGTLLDEEASGPPPLETPPTPLSGDPTEVYVEPVEPPQEAFDGWREVRSELEAATRGEFEIQEELGLGGMAKVYRARDLALGRDVAIKVMAPGLLMGSGMVDRFRQEAITIANLQHPNIVTIHTVRQAGSLHFFVMQLVEGGSLENVLNRPEPIPIFLAQVILYQLGVGLSFAHRRGVIHRDIKPANVLLDTEGNAILTDFGIAKVAAGSNLTQTGSTMGTPAYMSPEQCRARELTGASDQYALGVVAYEMLTGSPPFQGSPFEVMQAHTAEAPTSIRDRRPECPPELEDAVFRMLAKEPGDRFPDVAEAVEAIGGYLPGPHDPVRQDLVRLANLGEESPAAGDRPALSAPARSAGMTPDSSPTPVPTGAAGHRFTPKRILVTGGGLALTALAVWGALQLQAPSEAGSPSPGALPPVVAEITFPNPPEEVLVGSEIRVQARLLDEEGQDLSDEPVDWSSADPEIASVEGSSEEGSLGEALLTGLAPGSTTVLARAGEVERGFPVTVSPVSGGELRGELMITTPSRELRVGGRLSLAANLTDESGEPVTDPDVTWRSVNPSIAEVDPGSGVVTGRGLGRARVSATVGDQTASVELTVVGWVESLTIRPPGGSLQAGQRAVLRSDVSSQPPGYLGSTGIAWSSSDPSVASVSHAAGDSVVLTLAAAGEATLTARVGEVRTTATLRVVPAPSPVSLALSRRSVSFAAVEGGNAPEAETVILTVTGGMAPALGAVDYRGGVAGWLVPALGRSVGEETTLTLAVDPGGVAPGVHTAGVPVRAGERMEEVEVRFSVSEDSGNRPVEPDEAAAREIAQLLTDYADAINAKNVSLAREIFPSLPQDAIDDLVQLPETDTYYLQLAPGSLRLGPREGTLDGDVMSGVLGRDNRGELVRMIYTFGRAQRGWHIVAFRPGG